MPTLHYTAKDLLHCHQISSLTMDTYEKNSLYGELPKVYNDLRAKPDKRYPLRQRKAAENIAGQKPHSDVKIR